MKSSLLYDQFTFVILFYTLLTSSSITAVSTYKCNQKGCRRPLLPNNSYNNQNLDNSSPIQTLPKQSQSLTDQTQQSPQVNPNLDSEDDLIPNQQTFPNVDVPTTPPSNPSTSKYSGKATFYNPGLGACGTDANDNSMVVAIPAPNFDPMIPNGNPNKNTLCGKRVRIYSGNKFVDGVVVDRCPVCKFGDIDLSPAMFNQLAEPEKGFIYVEWMYL
ncbi:6103_t:CDS:1 [Ambispora gerdemannii]|uniref:6103_t:CDS:1 n=1 Tax=Ambispora gerdemannii TaxID=144530 RepID=A0A9N9FYN5_9GLOM|nr:6103_t:CDS:1 [Ambispora gerdemannii]